MEAPATVEATPESVAVKVDTPAPARFSKARNTAMGLRRRSARLRRVRSRRLRAGVVVRGDRWQCVPRASIAPASALWGACETPSRLRGSSAPRQLPLTAPLHRAPADYDYKFLCIPKWPYPICCGGKVRAQAPAPRTCGLCAYQRGAQPRRPRPRAARPGCPGLHPQPRGALRAAGLARRTSCTAGTSKAPPAPPALRLRCACAAPALHALRSPAALPTPHALPLTLAATQVNTRPPPTFFPLDEKMAFIPAAILGFQHMIAMLIGALLRRAEPLSAADAIQRAGLITPATIMANNTNDQKTKLYMINASIIVAGIMTIVQSAGIKHPKLPFQWGAGTLSVMGISFTVSAARVRVVAARPQAARLLMPAPVFCCCRQSPSRRLRFRCSWPLTRRRQLGPVVRRLLW